MRLPDELLDVLYVSLIVYSHLLAVEFDLIEFSLLSLSL